MDTHTDRHTDTQTHRHTDRHHSKSKLDIILNSINLLSTGWTLYIFMFRSYLVTNAGRMLVAKGKVLKFCEAYRTWWANALVKETPRDCTVVIEGVSAR